jgi:two-component sensor histidine kinase
LRSPPGKGECHWDEGQCRILGVVPGDFKITMQSVRTLVHPDDWHRLKSALEGIVQDGQPFQTEFRAVRPNGELRWCVGAAAASVDENNRAIRISGVTVDITEQKHADERRSLLVREVDHRARNALAVVQSIVRLTKADTIGSYKTAVEGRIRALSTAHALLSESRWEGADLAGLVNEELAPYRRPEADKVVVSGPPVLLQPSIAQIIAVVLHELATNAAKYGALSTLAGSVALSWEVADDTLVLRWNETGGPPIQPPRSLGYGTRVITASAEKQLGGSATFDWQPTGLRFVMSTTLGERPEAARPGTHANGSARENEAAGSGSRPLDGKRVLLVEDEALVGMMMQEALTDLGFQVIGPINTMAAAADAVRQGNFHAAILDVNLNGEFVYPLADVIAARGVPFIFVTGYGAEGVETRFSKVPILQKPIDIERLQNIFVLPEFRNPAVQEPLRTRAI